MAKQYLVKKPAGRFTDRVGQTVDAAEVESDPFHQKYLRSGSLVEVSEGEVLKPRTRQEQEALNEIDRQIAELQTRRAELAGEAPAEPTAFDLPNPDAGEQVDSTAQAEVRAAGREVVQPGPADAVAGEVKAEGEVVAELDTIVAEQTGEAGEAGNDRRRRVTNGN